MNSLLRTTLTGLAALMLLLSIPRSLLAQEKEPEDLHKYFEDGGLAKRKNLLSTNLLSPLWGTIGLRYERAIGKRFSVEVGVYKLMPFYIFELLLPVNVYFDRFDPKGGFGMSVSPHFFFWDKAPEFHYIGPRYGFRRHTLQDGGSLAIHDVTIDYGYNLFIGKHFMFCYDAGFGYRRMSYQQGGLNYAGNPRPLEKRGTLYSQFSAGIGVMF